MATERTHTTHTDTASKLQSKIVCGNLNYSSNKFQQLYFCKATQSMSGAEKYNMIIHSIVSQSLPINYTHEDHCPCHLKQTDSNLGKKKLNAKLYNIVA